MNLPLTYLDGKSIRNTVTVYSGNKNIPPYSFETETSYKALSDGRDGTESAVYEAIERRHVDTVNVPSDGEEVIQKRLAVFSHNPVTGEYTLTHNSLIGGNGYTAIFASPTKVVGKKLKNNAPGRQNNHIALSAGTVVNTLVDHDQTGRKANQRNNNFH